MTGFKFLGFAAWLVLLFCGAPALAQEPEVAAEAARGIGDWLALAMVVIGGLVTSATAIAAVTPNTRDDEIVGFVKTLLDKFSVGGFNNVGKKP